MIARLCLFAALVVLGLVGCASEPSAPDDASGGRGNGGDSGGTRATGGSGGSSVSSGGVSSGGASGLGGSAKSSGGASETGGALHSGGGTEAFGASSGAGGSPPESLYDCDARKIVCLPIVPVDPCEPMFVRSVEAACYGPCVPIDECGCQDKLDCPDPDQTEPYTCIVSAGHCSPWLQ